MDKKQDEKYISYRTERQFRLIGYALKSDAIGVILEVEGGVYTYYSESEVVFAPQLCKLIKKLKDNIRERAYWKERMKDETDLVKARRDKCWHLYRICKIAHCRVRIAELVAEYGTIDYNERIKNA